ncbi:hypothetical protein [Saccharibacillus brassicae]|uniref:hypothetical protein n=1 Tax=Saccharibacillus brassicae TaxID=2583377 RepID=UPI00123B4FBD
MSRFNEPEPRRAREEHRGERPNWYSALEREPGPIPTEPTLAQMSRIKEETNMEHTQTTVKRRGKFVGGAVLAAGVLLGGLWGANSAGWLDQAQAPNVAQTQVNPGSGQSGPNAGGILGGTPAEQQAQAAAEAEAREAAADFKREDLTVTQDKLDVFKQEFRQGEPSMIDWIERRHGELSPYAESEFLSVYFTNQAANVPYEAAIHTDSELSVEQIDMTTRSVDLEQEQVTFDYTLNLVFSGGRDPLPMKGSIRMQKGENGWKVQKDAPDKESFLELYKLAQPELSGAEEPAADAPAE